MSTNILVTGAGGQLGSELRYLGEDIRKNKVSLSAGYAFIFADKSRLDITDKGAIESFCSTNSVSYIINCAAFTAVDKAESEADKANAINHLAVKHLAEVAKKHDIAMIHISTDYVFDGDSKQAYKETDITHPNNVYGKTKRLGEQALQDISPPNSIIIRTSWLYSLFGSNFLTTMLRLGPEREQLNVVNDQIGSPTYARDLARAIVQIIPQLKRASQEVEIYHYSNQGQCSWYEFAKAIFVAADIDCRVQPIPSSDYPTSAKRPSHSVLATAKIEQEFGVELSQWPQSMKSCLAHY
ncbi:dTDP-4-dehydrorhamnose reductase [Psychrobacter submarinus]|uniref:dTDP-4-dehydrorhamnose reductase n=1 Tax=Psychrobacter submarinus TaxID=154108 RepID=UPI001919E8D0|nr:dTDP-4-dehydrorhamnose reductase [Psychrobacter submarinus]